MTMLADNGALLVVMAASVMATEAKYKNTELYFPPRRVKWRESLAS